MDVASRVLASVIALLLYQEPKVTLLSENGTNCVKAEYANRNTATYCRKGEKVDRFTLDAVTADGKVRQIKILGDCSKKIYKEGDIWVYESCVYPYSAEYAYMESQEAGLRRRAEGKRD